jgi:hypothetical protein
MQKGGEESSTTEALNENGGTEVGRLASAPKAWAEASKLDTY